MNKWAFIHLLMQSDFNENMKAVGQNKDSAFSIHWMHKHRYPLYEHEDNTI